MLTLQVILWLLLSPVMIVFEVIHNLLGIPLQIYKVYGKFLFDKEKELK